jgi:outer membrane protein assembly factor BamB
MRQLIALFACGLWGSTLLAADWPQWRGPNRDGVSTETGLLKEWPKDGPKLLWKADIAGVGYGSPTVVGDKLFASASDDNKEGKTEYAICLNVKDGKEVWKTPLPEGDGGFSHAWGSGPRSTPTYDDGFVYVLGSRGSLVCLKSANGEKVWSVNLKKDFEGGIPGWGYSDSVLIDGDNLICTPGGKNGTMLALNKKTGKKVWQSADVKDGAGYASIIAANIGGVRQYITQTQQAAIGVRASDGKLLWRVAELKRAVAVIPTPVVHENQVFLTTGYGAGCELIELTSKDGLTTAKTIYTQNKLMVNHHGGVIRLGDHIYGHSDNGGKWLCIDYKKAADGDAVWENKSLDKGSLIAADGHLYCYGQNKGVCCLVEAKPDGWKEKGRFEIPAKSQFPRGSGQIWAHPVVANGKLYLRDHELIFCYDISAK